MAPTALLDPRAVVIEALASAKTDGDVAAIEAVIADLGGDDDFHLDSKFAEAVIAYVEVLAGRRMRGPADLSRYQFATVGALVDAIRWQLG